MKLEAIKEVEKTFLVNVERQLNPRQMGVRFEYRPYAVIPKEGETFGLDVNIVKGSKTMYSFKLNDWLYDNEKRIVFFVADRINGNKNPAELLTYADVLRYLKEKYNQ